MIFQWHLNDSDDILNGFNRISNEFNELCRGVFMGEGGSEGLDPL